MAEELNSDNKTVDSQINTVTNDKDKIDDQNDLKTENDQNDLKTENDQNDLKTENDQNDLKTEIDQNDLKTEIDQNDLKTEIDQNALKAENDQQVLKTLNDEHEKAKEELRLRIIEGFKKLKEETGRTNEELFKMLMDADEDEKNLEEEEEEEEAPDDENGEEQDYGSPEYWENRYTICPEAFDWYQKWEAINNELSQLFNGDELVLNIGCGNSEMSAEMQKTTFQTVVSIDISSVVINQMIEKYKSNEDLLWFEMDCTNLTFEDEFFDIVFDKGTFDAILCGEDSVRNVFMSMKEIWRVLKFGGLFIEITYGKPSNRVDLFKNAGLSWKLYDPIVINSNEEDDAENEDDNNESERNHYIYIFQKLMNYNEEEEEDDKENNEINTNNINDRIDNNVDTDTKADH